MRTYLVGRKDQHQPCDIELPPEEMSVSRRHLELSVTDDGRLYVVHLHPQNSTAVRRGGVWQSISQDFVSLDEPLLLGAYETTARRLMAMAPGSDSHADSPSVAGEAFAWDPTRGTFLRRNS
jgi:FHA domain